jgi:hypothetical protein
MDNTRQSSRQRNWILTGWLALIVLFSLFTVISFLTGGHNSLQYQIPAEEATPQWQQSYPASPSSLAIERAGTVSSSATSS